MCWVFLLGAAAVDGAFWDTFQMKCSKRFRLFRRLSADILCVFARAFFSRMRRTIAGVWVCVSALIYFNLQRAAAAAAREFFLRFRNAVAKAANKELVLVSTASPSLIILLNRVDCSSPPPTTRGGDVRSRRRGRHARMRENEKVLRHCSD